MLRSKRQPGAPDVPGSAPSVILALTTSTPRGGAALVRDGQVPAEAVYVDLQGHAERIFQAIDEALAAAGERRETLTALAVDVGPGSFTGVRVGVASAKGIAFGLGVPLAGVVSIEAMAAAAFASGEAGPGDVVVAALDAKKDEVFLAAYGPGGEVLAAPSTRALAPESFALVPAPAGGRVVVVGEVAARVALPPGLCLARGPALDLPDAAWIGRLAAPRLGALDTDDIEPLYVRPPDAVPLHAPANAGPRSG